MLLPGEDLPVDALPFLLLHMAPRV
jgi:hypothetical protein